MQNQKTKTKLRIQLTQLSEMQYELVSPVNLEFKSISQHRASIFMVGQMVRSKIGEQVYSKSTKISIISFLPFPLRSVLLQSNYEDDPVLVVYQDFRCSSISRCFNPPLTELYALGTAFAFIFPQLLSMNEILA